MTIQYQPSALTAQESNQSVVDFSYTRVKVGLSLRCCNPVTERQTKNYAKESLNTQLVALADQMHNYIAVNHFYYDAVEALFSENEIADDSNEHSHYGLTLVTRWLCEQDKALLEALSQIKSQVASMTDGTLDAS